MQIQAFSGRYFVLCHNAMTPLWSFIYSLHADSLQLCQWKSNTDHRESVNLLQVTITFITHFKDNGSAGGATERHLPLTDFSRFINANEKCFL